MRVVEGSYFVSWVVRAGGVCVVRRWRSGGSAFNEKRFEIEPELEFGPEEEQGEAGLALQGDELKGLQPPTNSALTSLTLRPTSAH